MMLNGHKWTEIWTVPNEETLSKPVFDIKTFGTGMFEQSLNTERSYKWRLSGSAGQSEIGILCFDWLIHPGVSYSREICNFSGEFVIFQATAEGKIFRLFAFFLKRSAKTTRMTSTEHEFRHLHLI